MRPARKKHASLLGLIAGVASALFGKSVKANADDVERVDFGSSTQRMGVSFTERVREVFRNRWLKKS
ncbi:MAG: hypothetical protein ACYTFK_07255 [Planctomycetota bacterium]|jgi:hypothetical protein